VLFGQPGQAEGDGVVSVFTRRHYSAGKTGLASSRSPYVSEDLIGRTLSSFLRSGPVWGAGLLFLSKYPIEASFFLRHPLKADWEHMADKGVLWSTLRLPNGRRIRAGLGHYQEGTSPEAMAARRDQIRKTRKTTEFLGDPALVLGDLNVIGDTLEHAWMLSILEMIDGGCEATYRDPNPYQDKLKAPRTKADAERRLDYVLGTEHWRTVESSVPREFFLASGGYSLSDHDPVLARLLLAD
jgi:endonuclease/exonuclease/phosphatase family metal-dependent hydrolase